MFFIRFDSKAASFVNVLIFVRLYSTFTQEKCVTLKQISSLNLVFKTVLDILTLTEKNKYKIFSNKLSLKSCFVRYM